MIGIFCEVFGNTVRNRVLETLLIFTYTGIAIPDLAKETGISKQRAYQIIYTLEKKGLVIKHRMVGKTQLWILNEKNSEVKVLQISLKNCMKILSEEYKEKHPDTQAKAKSVVLNRA